MTDVQIPPRDLALDALTTLSDVTDASSEELSAVNDGLTAMREHRRSGWSWRRIVSASDSPNPLSLVASIAANLGRASGNFRRSLVRALRAEGMQVNEIGSLLNVSRQRVSALVRQRPKDSSAVNEPSE